MSAGNRGADDGEDQQRENERGDRHQHVDQTAQSLIGPSADCRGQEPAQRTDEESEQRGDKGDGDRIARAVDQPRERVAPEVVGTE